MNYISWDRSGDKAEDPANDLSVLTVQFVETDAEPQQDGTPAAADIVCTATLSVSNGVTTVD